MIRGTTPTHTFKTNLDTAIIDKVEITYAQEDVVVLTKTTEDCTLEDNNIITTLSQEETLQFVHDKPVQVQLRVMTSGGNVPATDIKIVDVGQLLANEVLQ